MAHNAGIDYSGNVTPSHCDCGCELPLTVCQSAAGYYVGRMCKNCGPYSRESGYYRTQDEAAADVAAVSTNNTMTLLALNLLGQPWRFMNLDTEFGG